MSASISELEELARRCRIEIVKMVYRAQAGHPGGSLSEIDLIAALYSTTMRVRPEDPDWADRDRFILSKGHASPGMYALLAEKGFIQHQDLHSYRVLGGICQGHVDMKWCPGVDFSAGSLGMGLSFGMGCALAARLDGSERRAFVMLGDGEIQEGSIWEAAMAATHHELGNLKVILDRNRIQNDDFCQEQMRMFDIPAKWKAFGWNVKEIDGHNMEEIVEGIKFLDSSNDGPSILIAHTIKGKGVSFMEDNPSFHGAAPNDEQYALAMSELGVVE
ncbi:MAG: transketolase [Euryarchaeota archaeon]|jgi:transketolase|nr:transketolase [Euryarchaeota archaeon]CAI8369087.1 MAG: Transketolase [Euryarchaeota archaeon UBA443]|tara:strand:- start:59 stop:883 length:825 start_codon:yes stop_codon:yes gene_type:complete